MRKIILSTLLGMAALCLYSCKKETLTPNPVVYPNYAQLKVGNYWIYERYEIDTLGNATPLGIIDSCFVEKDTIINNETYFKMTRKHWLFPESDSHSFSYLRDSLHYVVDNTGNIVFSSQDFSVLLEHYAIGSFNPLVSVDTVYRLVSKMDDPNYLVNVPAGQFSTLNFKTTYEFYPNWGGNTRYSDIRYAENIGIVVEDLPFFISNPNHFQRRLLRYYVQ